MVDKNETEVVPTEANDALMQTFNSLASSFASITDALEEQRSLVATQTAKSEEHETPIKTQFSERNAQLQERDNMIQNQQFELLRSKQK